jgi:amidophosphoribosyltransferase
MKDQCGVFGAYNLNNKGPVIGDIVEGLFKLQHRGQLSAGVTVFDQTRKKILNTFKKNGLVHEVFGLSDNTSYENIKGKLSGHLGIGHVRYATSGHGGADAAQPFEYKSPIPNQWFSFAFNGNIANYEELAENLRQKQYWLVHDVDTEVIMHYFSSHLASNHTYEESFRYLQETLDGAFSIVMLNGNGDFFAYRDKHGFKPLSYTVTNEGLCLVSSETSALDNYSSEIHHIQPGELLTIRADTKELIRKQLFIPEPAHCFFEYVYFSYPTSNIDGNSVYQSRFRAGEELARIEDYDFDDNCVVVPVPDSARIAAEGYATSLGLPLRNGILRNTYAGRTFIENKDRIAKVQRKYAFPEDVIKGKKVFLVEDSLVRSTTLKSIIEAMKQKCEPAEVHVRIAAPPLFAPCFYGIDIPSQDQLFAPKFSTPIQQTTVSEDALKKMAEALSVDSIKYLPIEAIRHAIGNDVKFCMACVTGQYPTEGGAKRFKK